MRSIRAEWTVDDEVRRRRKRLAAQAHNADHYAAYLRARVQVEHEDAYPRTNAHALYAHHAVPAQLVDSRRITLPDRRIARTTLELARAALEADGCCVLRGVLERDEAEAARRALTSLHEEQRRRPRLFLSAPPPAADDGAAFIEVCRGRFHLDGWRLARPEVWAAMWTPSVRLHPLVRAFLGGGDEDDTGVDIRLHDLQGVISEPGSDSQHWHADNTARGLTVMVALADVAPEQGPPQCWPHAMTRPMRALRLGPHPPLARASGPSVDLLAGDALILDSRVMHRGLANESDEPRPILVWQFTDATTPPPGSGVLGVTLKNYYMRALRAAHTARDSIFGRSADSSGTRTE